MLLRENILETLCAYRALYVLVAGDITTDYWLCEQ
jgi:hypothetical protein